MSKFSPCRVEGEEDLTLFIFNPMMQLDKQGLVKPNVFSHVHKKGRSVQRNSIANPEELTRFVTKFLSSGDDRSWKGVVEAKCSDIRSLVNEAKSTRAVCVYDTAEEDNPAHCELCQSHELGEEDEIELRHNLLKLFGEGRLTVPDQFRQGAVWNLLPQELKNR